MGRLEVAKHLIASGALVNQAKKDGSTPLYIASCNGHLEVAKHLIASGALVNNANNRRRTPLYIASRKGHLEVAKHLIAYPGFILHKILEKILFLL